MTSLLNLPTLPEFKSKNTVRLDLSYTQAILIGLGLGLGLGALALRFMAFAGSFCLA